MFQFIDPLSHSHSFIYPPLSLKLTHEILYKSLKFLSTYQSYSFSISLIKLPSYFLSFSIFFLSLLIIRLPLFSLSLSLSFTPINLFILLTASLVHSFYISLTFTHLSILFCLTLSLTKLPTLLFKSFPLFH